MVLVDCVIVEVSGSEGEGEWGGAVEGGEGVGAAVVFWVYFCAWSTCH